MDKPSSQTPPAPFQAGPDDTLIRAIAEADGLRLDAFVAEACTAQGQPATRVLAGQWVREGRVSVEGRLIKPSLHLRAGDVVHVCVPAPARAEAEPEDLPLPILYQDAHLVVVDKPAGMATHPGPGWWRGSALNALLFHVQGWRPINGVAVPGIVHRLDRDTSGLLIFANGQDALNALLEAMRARRIQRRYWALVEGELSGSGTFDGPLDRDPARPERVIVTPTGQRAVTHYRALGQARGRTLLELTLETGRTHQIRVHLADAGFPVVGDPWYGPGADATTTREAAAAEGPEVTPEGAPEAAPGPALALHAHSLAFAHPLDGRPLEFQSLPPWEALTDPFFKSMLNPK